MKLNGKIKSTSVVIALMCLFLSVCNEKPHQEKVFKVGILCGLNFVSDITDGFKSKMAELGYIEGKNIIYDVQNTNVEPERENQILKKFVADKVDLIFTFPTEVSMFAKQATQGTKIPVLFSFANIEDTDLVESISHPGGNITGVRFPGPDLAIKRFEIMMEIVPKTKRIWIPYQRNYPIVKSQMQALYPAAKVRGIILEEFPADSAAEIQTFLTERAKRKNIGMDAIFFIAEPLTLTPDAFEVISKFAYEQKIPLGGAPMMVGDYGSIFGIIADTKSTGKQAAVLADKILKGTPACEIPIMSSENYFEINYRVAQKFGITISEGLLSQANKIIR
jgi:putative tryptophan/tyrosine transport system substrate-binding protein